MNRAFGLAAAMAAGLAPCVPASAQSCATQQARLTSPTGSPADVFGISARIDGDLAIVGAHGGGRLGLFVGEAYVFARDAAGDWAYEATLSPAGRLPEDFIGRAVDLSGRFAIVGADGNDMAAADAGAAFIFEREAPGMWAERATLLPASAGEGDATGWSVALDGPVAAVGAPTRSGVATWAGAATVFVREGAEWVEELDITATTPAAFNFLGESVACVAGPGGGLEGAMVAAGAWGDSAAGDLNQAVYVHRRGPSGWELDDRLVGDDTGLGDQFGWRVAMDGATLAVAAQNYDRGAGTIGAVYIFERDSEGWSQAQRLEADGAVADEFFAISVAVGPGAILVGSAVEDGAGGEIRWMSVYTLAGGRWEKAGELRPEGGDPSEVFGFSADVSGGRAIAGALRKAGSGAAYIYDIGGCACRPDLDGDGALTFFDFLAFQNLFAAGDPRADFDGSGTLDFFDFLAFQNAFAAGC